MSFVHAGKQAACIAVNAHAGSRTLLEIKNVVCADFKEGAVPTGRPKVRGLSELTTGQWVAATAVMALHHRHHHYTA
jgi:hypothetical protein